MDFDQLSRELRGAVNGMKGDLKREVSAISDRVDDIQARISRPVSGGGSTGNRNGKALLRAFAHQLKEQRGDIEKFGQVSFELDGSISKDIDSSAGVPTPTGRVLDGARVGAPFLLREKLPSTPLGGASAWSVAETALTSNVVQQTNEGDTFGSSNVVIGGDALKFETFGHYVTVSEQAMEDLEELAEYLNTVLGFGLASKIENYLLTALTTNAPSTNTNAYWATGVDNRLDELAAAAAQHIALGYYPTVAVVNPQQFLQFRTLKANTGGQYLYSAPADMQPPAAFGMAGVPSTHMTANNYALIDPAKVMVWERLKTRIEVGRINDDFGKGLVRVRAIERLVLARPSANVTMKGAFTK